MGGEWLLNRHNPTGGGIYVALKHPANVNSQN